MVYSAPSLKPDETPHLGPLKKITFWNTSSQSPAIWISVPERGHEDLLVDTFVVIMLKYPMAQWQLECWAWCKRS